MNSILLTFNQLEYNIEVFLHTYIHIDFTIHIDFEQYFHIFYEVVKRVCQNDGKNYQSRNLMIGFFCH